MLQKLTHADFDDFFALLEESFPLDEYRPYEEQRALLDDPRYCAYVLFEGGEIKLDLPWEQTDMVDALKAAL